MGIKVNLVDYSNTPVYQKVLQGITDNEHPIDLETGAVDDSKIQYKLSTSIAFERGKTPFCTRIYTIEVPIGEAPQDGETLMDYAYRMLKTQVDFVEDVIEE